MPQLLCGPAIFLQAMCIPMIGEFRRSRGVNVANVIELDDKYAGANLGLGEF